MKRSLMLAIMLAVFVMAGLCCKDKARADRGAAAVLDSRAPDKSIPEKDIFTITSAGRWFPADAAELEQIVDTNIGAARKTDLPGRITALISPHAGYPFSGPVAGWAYRQIQGLGFDTVVVVGFRHSPACQGIATVATGGFRTPLGVIPLDADMAAALLAASDLVRDDRAAFKDEHSLDNQLPFLQRALGDFKLVPVILCSQDQANVDALAQALAQVTKGKNALLVASTDMSHFWTHEQAKDLDEAALKPVLALDAPGLEALLRDDPSGRRLCGRGAVLAVMRAAKALGADRATLLHYADSKDTSGYDDPQNGVVGYAAVAFTNSKEKNTPAHGREASKATQGKSPAKSGRAGELTKDDQAELLRIARQALDAFIRDGETKSFSSERAALKKQRGVFVTLNKNGELRGCMGHFEADTPLHEIVARQTLMSAVRDPRFPPVAVDELDEISIEISVLSEPEPVASYEDIEVGRHGVILQKNGHGATFLPQVAPEQGWTRDEMLAHLCLKAGLPADAWKTDASFMVYTAQVFDDNE